MINFRVPRVVSSKYQPFSFYIADLPIVALDIVVGNMKMYPIVNLNQLLMHAVGHNLGKRWPSS